MNNHTIQNQQSKELYCIYLHTCTITNLGYVGQTIRGIDKRWVNHLLDARAGKGYYFHKAIEKYGEKCWTHDVLYVAFEKNSKHLEDVETQLIADYDTYKNGYNLTTGGRSSIGSENPMWGKTGDKCINYNHTKYTFKHNKGEVFRGTQYNFQHKYNLDQGTISKIISGKKPHD